MCVVVLDVVGVGGNGVVYVGVVYDVVVVVGVVVVDMCRYWCYGCY